MSRRNQPQNRKSDRPAYALERVLQLVERQFVHLEPKAAREAAALLGDELVSLRNEVLELLSGLTADEWCFRQEKNGEWVDVYRIEFEEPPPAWVKLKIETINDYEALVVISFHEFDDARGC
jgi:hypothetical protein